MLEVNDAYNHESEDDWLCVVSDETLGSWPKMNAFEYANYVAKTDKNLGKLLGLDNPPPKEEGL